MAFKILTEEQIELLTDEQKSRYAQELELYRQREEFVQQIEKFENMTLPPVQANVKPIAVVQVAETPEISIPETEVELPRLSIDVQTPKLSESFDVQIDVSNLPSVSTEHPELHQFEFENIQPTVPAVPVPAVAEYNYKAPTAERIRMPEPIQVAVPEMKPVQIGAPEPISMPEPVSIPAAVVKPVRMERPEVELPSVELARIQVPEIGPMEPQKAVLPQLEKIPVSTVDADRVRAAMRELPQPELPQVELPTAEMPKLGNFETVVEPLPQVTVAAASAPTIRMPENTEVRVPQLPSVPDLPPIPTLHFDLPEMDQLPTVQVRLPDTAAETAFTMPELTVQTPTVPIPTIPEGMDELAQRLRMAESAPAAQPAIPEIPTVKIREVHMEPIGRVELPKISVNAAPPDKAQMDEIIKQIQGMV